MRSEKNAAIGAALGKSDDWARKVLEDDCGIRLADLPALLDMLGLKVVDRAKVLIHPEVALAYETIVRRAVGSHDLLREDVE